MNESKDRTAPMSCGLIDCTASLPPPPPPPPPTARVSSLGQRECRRTPSRCCAAAAAAGGGGRPRLASSLARSPRSPALLARLLTDRSASAAASELVAELGCEAVEGATWGRYATPVGLGASRRARPPAAASSASSIAAPPRSARPRGLIDMWGLQGENWRAGRAVQQCWTHREGQLEGWHPPAAAAGPPRCCKGM